MKKIRFLFFCLFIALKIYSQDISFEAVYNNVKDYYGNDIEIVNGYSFAYVHSRDQGHPFLINGDFSTGIVNINGVVYSSQKVMYDVFEQNIILLKDDENGKNIAFIPPVDFVNEFSLVDRKFKKIEYDGEVSFYEVIYSGNISCLYSWRKVRSELNQVGTAMAYRYSDVKHKKYIVIDGIFEKYGSNGSFVRKFPAQYKKDIVKYIKQHKINIKNSSNSDIYELVAYCNSLIIK